MASKRRRLNDDAISAPTSSASSVAPRRKVSRVTDISDNGLREKVTAIQKRVPDAAVHDILLALEVRKGSADDAMELLRDGSLAPGDSSMLKWLPMLIFSQHQSRLILISCPRSW